MRYLSVAEMREADRRAIEELGIPGAVLMNSAGKAVFRELPGGSVGIVCGKGNNGGDGFVVARLCLLAGREVRLVLIADEEEISGDAHTFMRVYQNLGGAIESGTADGDVRAAMEALESCDTIVDALLGTGIRGVVKGPQRAAIDAWPDRPTVAVDLPSGLNADTGEPCGACVRAMKTVTFQFAKRGFQNPEAAEYVGQLVVADIGIPEICADDEAWLRRTNG